MIGTVIPGTVCCLLCHGIVIYKDGDSTRFVNHMKSEHSAFFDMEYLLASCLMDTYQKASVAKTVKYPELLESGNDEAGDNNLSLKESSEVEVPVGRELKREKFDVPGPGPQESHFNYTTQNQTSNFNIKQEKQFDDPSMDPINFTSISEASAVYRNEFLSSSADNDLKDDDKREESHKRKFDQAQEELNANGRLVCQAEGCEKSFTLKTNRRTHEKKVHGLESKFKKKSKNVGGEDGLSEAEHSIKLNKNLSNETSDWDELEKMKSQLSASESNFESSVSTRAFEASIETFSKSTDFISDQSINTSVSSVEDDQKTSAGSIDSNQPVTEANNPPLPFIQGIDLSSSRYFTKNPKAITSARGKSLQLFNEIPVGLAEGWKMRTFEVDTKAGTKSVVKHYLTPELKVLKSGVAVVEYLRLKGEMDEENLVEIGKVLNVSDSKLRSLFEKC